MTTVKKTSEIRNEIVEIIKKNIDKSTNEILWIKEIRDYNWSTSDLLVLISENKKLIK